MFALLHCSTTYWLFFCVNQMCIFWSCMCSQSVCYNTDYIIIHILPVYCFAWNLGYFFSSLCPICFNSTKHYLFLNSSDSSIFWLSLICSSWMTTLQSFWVRKSHSLWVMRTSNHGSSKFTLLWRVLILSHIYSEPLQFIMDADGNNTKNPEYAKFIQRDNSLASWLLSCISSQLNRCLFGCMTICSIWQKLHQVFSSSSITRIMSLYDRIKFESSHTNLCVTISRNFKPHVIVLLVVDTLLKRFHIFRSYWMVSKVSLTMLLL